MSDPIVGIDLGTSNSVVAHASAAGSVTVLADDAGYKIHPSVVSFHPNGGVVVGAAAKQRKVIDPQNTVYSVKRLIGRSYSSPEVQTARTRVPFQIKEGPNAAPVIATRGGTFAVPELSAIVLDHVRNIAAARLERPVERAVVTVPASFNDAQRSATATAGAIAGLTVVRVLNEPTAAALAYGHNRHLREVIAVYDFGGGTFDITFLRLEDQVYEVLGTSGDTFLGGDDFDERLVEKMVAKFLVDNRIDLRSNEVAMMRLRAVAEQTKIELSRRTRAVVRVDEIAYGPRGAPLNLQIEITRDEFVREISDLVDRTFPVCSEALALANLTVDQIADVILVGGSTKIPYVRDQVSKFFGKAPRADVNPEDAVAAGAALQATSLERILARKPSIPRGASPPAPPAEPSGSPPPVSLHSTKHSISRSASEDTAIGATDVLQLADAESGATMAPSELTVSGPDARVGRPAGGPAGALRPATEPTRPDTRYSVSRAGLRDEAPGAERYPVAPLADPPGPPAARPGSEVGFDDVTAGGSPIQQTQPLARMARVAPVPGQNRTVFGVPAAPSEVDVELGSAGTAGERADRPITATGTASPPPVPRPALRQAAARSPVPPIQTTAPLPAIRKTPGPRPAVQPLDSGWLDAPPPPERRAADSAAATRPESWVAKNPATTQPLAPTTPIAPPTAPTLVAAFPEPPGTTARGMGALSLDAALSLDGDPSPATTARGFQPPQSYPILPPPVPASPPYSPPPSPQGSPLPYSPPVPAGPLYSPPPPSYPPPAMSPTYVSPSPSPSLPYSAPVPAAPSPSQPVPQPVLQAMYMPSPSAPTYVPPPMPAYAPPAPVAPPPAPVLLEVTPRGLGIATVAGFCEELIRRNARLPTEARKLFITSRDNQDQVRIIVCQGESRRLDNNTVIGDLVLQGLPPRLRGETSIEVTFALDGSGVLQVRARDAQTGAEQRATLSLVGGVAQEDVAASRDRLQQLRR
ncbi:MAG TPA: Hsp70 family protein [Kofleriaceae bacterium]|nr:Hsp70 family protein [Kofleriaceae bacterium]